MEVGELQSSGSSAMMLVQIVSEAWVFQLMGITKMHRELLTVTLTPFGMQTAVRCWLA